jgi:hypothetical protein
MLRQPHTLRQRIYFSFQSSRQRNADRVFKRIKQRDRRPAVALQNNDPKNCVKTILKKQSSVKSRLPVRRNASDQRGKTQESRLWFFGERRPSRKSNGRRRAPVEIAHTADASLLHSIDSIRCLQPIFCKCCLKRPFLVALNQEVALLDWDARYTIYVHPDGTGIEAVGHRDAAMLRRMAQNSYVAMKPYKRKVNT